MLLSTANHKTTIIVSQAFLKDAYFIIIYRIVLIQKEPMLESMIP